MTLSLISLQLSTSPMEENRDRISSCKQKKAIFKTTINVPVVYMARDLMILMEANPFWGPTPSNGLSNGFAPIKIIKFQRQIKKQVH